LKKILILLLALSVAGCTNDGKIYNQKKHTKKDFSVSKTAGLIIGTILVVAAANNGAGGSAPAGDYDWDWDYQPANGRWVCRGIQTGQYAKLSNCAGDIKDDDRWLG